jgi:hypothetical protein
MRSLPNAATPESKYLSWSSQNRWRIPPASVESRIVKVLTLLLFAYWKG